jgi:hypothetical protein
MELNRIIDSVKHCYSNIKPNQFSPTNQIADKLIQANIFEHENLEDFFCSINSSLELSLIKRVIAVNAVRQARDNGIPFNSAKIWKLLISSILELDSSQVLSSLGSQGFLSVPISRVWKPLTEFDMIRIHIWDKSLDKYLNKEKVETFSIHCHKFHAHSWIMNGNLINSVYEVKETENDNKHALFKIERGDSKNAKSHTSLAVNTNSKVDLKLKQKVEYTTGDSYQVPIGEFHQSKVNFGNKPTITIFSFTAKNNSVSDSFVVGPNNIKESEVSRKAIIDPKPLLNDVKNLFT